MEPQMDMQQLFAAAQQMQEQLMNAQAALADAEVTGTAGGGLPGMNMPGGLNLPSGLDLSSLGIGGYGDDDDDDDDEDDTET